MFLLCVHEFGQAAQVSLSLLPYLWDFNNAFSCMRACSCLYRCTCLHRYAYTYVHRCVEARGQLQVLLQCCHIFPLFLLFETGSLTDLELAMQARLAGQHFLGSACLCPLSSAMLAFFKCRLWGWNSTPAACKSNIY